jgi:transposase
VVERREQILRWLERIARSRLSAPAFFDRYSVPFSMTQLYRYRKAFNESGIEGLEDQRQHGNNRRMDAEAEAFLMGCASMDPEVTQAELRQKLLARFRIRISQPGMSRCLQRLGLRRDRRPRAPEPMTRAAAHAGFELVVALALHFQWPQWMAGVIKEGIREAKRSARFASESIPDLKGRTRRGRFTVRYNRRPDVRRQRFESVALKRSSRSLQSMDIAKVDPETLARKCLAVLTLPFITHNGEVRTVNTAPGTALKDLCGFDYRQATLAKFLAELKYLGISEQLLRRQVKFWADVWRDVLPECENLPLLCYYVDGNTKALWSSKRVKKHKVTMLGRVMGCLEQVFIHDGHGRPIYFETYSGHAPLGEHVLGLFEKIEDSLEGPGPKLPVQRAIVMDAASNSVRTLRAFAAQKKYHYITSLDENQWDLRKVRKEGRPQRYRFGEATLWDCEIELEDSTERGYLFVTRATKIEWDRGKETYLITSLPKETIGASAVVKAYFDRWPDEELSFKIMEAVGCLHRIAGYGKQKLPDLRVRKRQAELAERIEKLRVRLREPIGRIADAEMEIANLIPKERRLRARSRIVDGKRILPSAEAEEFRVIGRQINALERTVNAIRKEYPEFRKLDRAERQWIRLQGKDTIYTVDVELDQLMTFFRVSLVNLYTYLARMMGWSHLSLVRLVHTVLLLGGEIEETSTSKRIILERNKKDPRTMEALSAAIEKLNALEIRNPAGQKLSVALETVSI